MPVYGQPYRPKPPSQRLAFMDASLSVIFDGTEYKFASDHAFRAFATIAGRRNVPISFEELQSKVPGLTHAHIRTWPSEIAALVATNGDGEMILDVPPSALPPDSRRNN
jgi:hypothetical protein